ncbi:m23B subfamily peptidase [Clostridium sp. CAG:1000]|nr:m23B subfamily peptidase [Clostridium sp. CAG:1000]
MMKKVSRIILCAFSFFMLVNNVAAISLKDYRIQYEKDLAKYNNSKNKQAEAKSKINSLQGDIGNVGNNIAKYQKDIENSKAKIEELNKEIEEKKKEIDNLLSFMQISEGDNVYLEYIFEATSFTDFIYRSAIVEQLTKYNDELIDDMYKKIEENKQLQKKLAKQIEDSEKEMDKLNNLLNSANVSLNQLVDEHVDIEEDMDASKKQYEYFKKEFKNNGCSEDTDINVCLKVPSSTGFIRPLVKATVTSEFGMRYHPTRHIWTLHSGIDLGVPIGTNVYPAANGVVTKIARVKNPNIAGSSCGGNKIYVKHLVNGKEFVTVYMHVHTIKVNLGDYVTVNTVIAGSGGGESYDYCTTGPHLHFSIMKENSYLQPRNYVSFPAKGKRFTSRY